MRSAATRCAWAHVAWKVLDLFGPSGTGHVRLSYALEDGRLEEGLNRLGEYVQRLQGDLVREGKRAA